MNDTYSHRKRRPMRMPYRRSLTGGVLTTLFVFVPASQGYGANREMAPGPADDRDDTPQNAVASGLKTLETEHFLVRYDTDAGLVKDLAGVFESTFDDVVAYCGDLGLEIHLPHTRLRVVLFDSPEVLNAYCRSLGIASPGTSGFYSTRRNLTLLTNISNHPDVRHVTERIDALSGAAAGDRTTRRQQATLRERRSSLVRTFNQLVIRHELAHHVLFNVGVHRRDGWNPDWLVEGLACAFEESAGSDSPSAPVNGLRLADLRVALRFDPSTSTKKNRSRRFAEAVKTGRLVRLEDLIAPGDALDPAGEHAAMRYAQAWSLVYYLRHHHGQALCRYIQQEAGGKSALSVDSQRARKDFDASFGPLNAHFVAAWLEHVDEAFLSD